MVSKKYEILIGILKFKPSRTQTRAGAAPVQTNYKLSTCFKGNFLSDLHLPF